MYCHQLFIRVKHNFTSSFIHRIFNNVTNHHLSRTYRRMKQVSNVNRSARNVSCDGQSIQHVLFDTLAIYMGYRESSSDLFHGYFVSNSYDTDSKATVQNVKAKLTDNLSAATSSLWIYSLYSNAVYDHFS